MRQLTSTGAARRAIPSLDRLLKLEAFATLSGAMAGRW